MFEICVDHRQGDFQLAVDCRSDSRVLGVFGASGGGKTTLLHVMAGLIRPRSGRVVIDGQVMFDSAKGIDVSPHERRIGVVFQDDRLFPHRSVRGNLMYGQQRRAGAATVSFDEVVDLLDLRELLERRPDTLSGGERRRCAIGRALLMSPRVLLLDEPLSFLDEPRRAALLRYLVQVRDAFAIPMVYVTHDLAEMLHMTDWLLLVEGGRQSESGEYGVLVREQEALPLTAKGQLTNVLRGIVRESGDQLVIQVGDNPSGVLVHAAAAGRFADGDTVSLTIDARDVALARGEMREVSIQNQLSGRVVHVSGVGGSVVVQVDVGGVTALAEVTARAASTLEVAPGAAVVVLIKAHAIRVAPG